MVTRELGWARPHELEIRVAQRQHRVDDDGGPAEGIQDTGDCSDQGDDQAEGVADPEGKSDGGIDDEEVGELHGSCSFSENEIAPSRDEKGRIEAFGGLELRALAFCAFPNGKNPAWRRGMRPNGLEMSRPASQG